MIDQYSELAGRRRRAHRRVKRVVLTPAGSVLYNQVKFEAVAFRKELLTRIDRRKLLAATELLEALQAVAERKPGARPACTLTYLWVAKVCTQ